VFFRNQSFITSLCMSENKESPRMETPLVDPIAGTKGALAPDA
jgi:hypothetical protein